MPTYAVGDLQGCLAPLLQLLDDVSFSPATDQLWLAGDLVNRGPASLETLRFVKQLGNSAAIVLGNHDLHLLAVSRGHKTANPKDTLSEILEAPDSADLLDWLIQQPLIQHHEALNYTMVHAGIPPIWSVTDALAMAKEVQQALTGDNADAFFAAMYGNEPRGWKDSLQGNDRLRVITNYFTRMRFCDAQGQLELKTKTDPSTAPDGFRPWFSHEPHRCANDRVIFGHWASLQGKTQRQNFIALDTGCVWGGELTMIRLDDGQLFSCDCGL